MEFEGLYAQIPIGGLFIPSAIAMLSIAWNSSMGAGNPGDFPTLRHDGNLRCLPSGILTVQIYVAVALPSRRTGLGSLHLRHFSDDSIARYLHQLIFNRQLDSSQPLRRVSSHCPISSPAETISASPVI